MKTPVISLWLLSALVCLAAATAPAADDASCAGLAKQKYENVAITSAVFLNDALGFLPPRTPGVFGTPPGLKVTAAFCRVIGFIEPVKNSHINFEVWLPPAEKWNNRYFAVGNPAFEGAIKYQGLAVALEKGYATASTDTGHQDPGHKWGMGHPERLIDWTHRAVHETTVAAKQLIRAFYGRPARYSYWDSCHNGGRQGLTEAQLYPEDFDGIVSGDPAYYLTRLQAGSEYLSWVALKDGTDAPAYIPPAKYAALHRAVLAACDAIDGVKDDAIEDPTRCSFDPASIQCRGADNASCLTPPQVETARRLYAGAKFADGTQIYSGFEPGSELVWGAMIAGPEPLFINNDFFRYIAFENPEWDYGSFDVDPDTRRIEARLGPIIDNTQTDLSAFKARGGKLIMYQAWNETWVPPRTATTYYNSVVKTMGGESGTKDFFRLFMVPDFGMCPGGFSGTFDSLGAVQKWVEQGIAPDQIKANYADRGRIYKTRPVCPYPQVAIYKGSGDTNDAANFTCGIPTW
ncbi:MAG: tannase/feruloyl esterase family alpha/beta hydrolase [Acidobacteria bacterium]|nr:tannase/feruloyl esterase family alpha/beta hydrolase [Acidobacteriota bacterium]